LHYASVTELLLLINSNTLRGLRDFYEFKRIQLVVQISVYFSSLYAWLRCHNY